MRDFVLDVIAKLKAHHVDYADIRYVKHHIEATGVRNGKIDTLSDNYSEGYGIRVLLNGYWGFAASSLISEADKTIQLAIAIAKASSFGSGEPTKLAPNPSYNDSYHSPMKINPFEVPLDKKIDLLKSCCDVMMQKPGIVHTLGSLDFYDTEKFFANTEGSIITQRVIESGGSIQATGRNASGETQSRGYPASHRGNFAAKGWEFIEEMDLLGHAAQNADEAIQLVNAEHITPGEYTLIIGGDQLALQVHESCGHPTELDRVFGDEISLAGGSFMTVEKLNKLKYGSNIVTIMQDATIPESIGSFGYDDEGVKAQRKPIIQNGLFVDYLSSRETAFRINKTSSGAMRASSWDRIPLIRMTNINLEPGDAGSLNNLISSTKHGIYVRTNKSWSIDDIRWNFQFGVQWAQLIENGKLTKVVKDVFYEGITPEFWNSCDAICSKEEWKIWGVPNCGKGEPGQTMHVAHGTAPARFNNVKVGMSK